MPLICKYFFIDVVVSACEQYWVAKCISQNYCCVVKKKTVVSGYRICKRWEIQKTNRKWEQ